MIQSPQAINYTMMHTRRISKKVNEMIKKEEKNMNEIRRNNEIEKEERDNPERPTSDSNNKQPKENVNIKSNNVNLERI
jgi:hypothetical protein